MKHIKKYELIIGNPPVWKGEHKEFGTINTLFNFQNTYLELLAAKGEGIGADLVKHTLANTGEGLNGIVFGTSDINQFRNTLKKSSFNLADPSLAKVLILIPERKELGLINF